MDKIYTKVWRLSGRQSVKVHQNTLKYIKMHQIASKYIKMIKIHQNLSKHIKLHTSHDVD